MPDANFSCLSLCVQRLPRIGPKLDFHAQQHRIYCGAANAFIRRFLCLGGYHIPSHGHGHNSLNMQRAEAERERSEREGDGVSERESRMAGIHFNAARARKTVKMHRLPDGCCFYVHIHSASCLAVCLAVCLSGSSWRLAMRNAICATHATISKTNAIS